MLLRRIVDHLKAQNWTAVFLDLFIVVVGVFIGIQAANWNDERQQREKRETAIERLQSESEAAVTYLRNYLQYMRLGASARESVLRKAADGNVDAVEQREIVLAVNFQVFFPPVAPPRSVYDEIISAGQYTEIGDADVRDAINRFYSSLDHLSSGISYARTLSQQWPVWDHPAIIKEFDPDDKQTQTRTVVDIEMALGDPHFVKSLQMGHSMQMLSIDIWEGTLVDAEHMCGEIARYSARPCATIDSDSSPAP